MARKGSDFPEYAKWVRIYGGVRTLEEVIYKALLSRQSFLSDEHQEQRKESMRRHRASAKRIVNDVPLEEVNKVRDRIKNFLETATYRTPYPPLPEIVEHEKLYKQFLERLPQIGYSKNPPVMTGDELVPIAPPSVNDIPAYVEYTKKNKAWWTRNNEVENFRFLKRFKTWLDAGAPTTPAKKRYKE